MEVVTPKTSIEFLEAEKNPGSQNHMTTLLYCQHVGEGKEKTQNTEKNPGLSQRG
jgi:hypothetical protein